LFISCERGDGDGAETHLGGGVMSLFSSRRSPLLEYPALTFVGSTALRKAPQRF